MNINLTAWAVGSDVPLRGIKMILQLHHQHKKFPCKVDFPDSFCSQREIDPGDHEAMREWLEETEKDHPVPEDMMWMVCNEESKHFIMTHGE